MHRTTTEKRTCLFQMEWHLISRGRHDMIEHAYVDVKCRSLLVIGFLVVIVGVWIAIKILRVKNSEMRIRRYDILSAKQLVPDHIRSEDSDDELLAPVRRDDFIRHLIPENTIQ
ncbi:unnamed protein product [Acanthocheilonema viteae]|uniref:Uncharacterized protein n=1 Tax=Acanthocheilonema viteae TaxID=6277 RepID=A0A498STF0_ACAVI|nr:unnamed protein product [Acanthocheilonema viteae]